MNSSFITLRPDILVDTDPKFYLNLWAVYFQVALNNKFNLSLFERLNSHFRFSHHNPVIMLDTQYRMDPEICYFPSNYIYDGKLKTDR